MKASELRQKSNDELHKMLNESSRELFNLKMQQGTGQLAKPDKMKKARREIARIQTLLNELSST